jgi:predicted nucleic acid-binding protein
MLLVDTNVLVDVLADDPEWADWSIGQLRAQSKIHRLGINPIIYAELSLNFSTVEALDRTIEGLGLALIEVPRPALFLAGKAFVRYRRQGGRRAMSSPISLLAHMQPYRGIPCSPGIRDATPPIFPA